MPNTRWTLPLINVTIALACKISNLQREISFDDPRWMKPDRQICDGLNAPAALVRYLLVFVTDRSPWPEAFELIIERVLFFALVGVVWYIVSIEASGGGRSVLTARTAHRKVADSFALFFGASVVWGGLQLGMRLRGNAVASADLIVAMWAIWGLTIIGFYGHDLWVCSRGPKPQPSPYPSPRTPSRY